jgi:Ca2+-binding EF-hand superfamily protein
MRESFAVLDRSNTGTITPADVAQQLSELGLDSSSSALSSYFSPGSTQSINLATYLNNLSSDLATLTRQDELMAAFSAFDEDDSGQIDVEELRDAVMHTLPEPGSGDRQLSESEIDRVMQGFVGRRAFKKGQVGNSSGLGGKKDVFRYGDFVAGIWGGNGEMQKGAEA